MKTNFVPVSNLIEAARNIAADPSSASAHEALTKALTRIEECAKEQAAHAGAIAQARKTYAAGNDDIEIDDQPLLSIGDEGVFVGAWVWVPLDNTADDSTSNG